MCQYYYFIIIFNFIQTLNRIQKKLLSFNIFSSEDRKINRIQIEILSLLLLY